MKSQPDLGRRLGELRRTAGLSQAALGGGELTASYISLLEAGKREPLGRTLELLAERLGTSPAYLLTGVDADERKRLELELRYAELALRSGEPAEAWRRYGELVADPAAERAGVLTDALLGFARSCEALGQLEEAVRAYARLQQRAADDPTQPGWWPATLGLLRCHREMGDLGYAIDLGEVARERLRFAGLLATDMGVQVVATLVAAYFERGDLGRARQLVDETIAAAEGSGSRLARGSAYWNASVLAQEQGRVGEALALADRALALYSEGDDARSQLMLREAQGFMLLRAEPPRPAEALGLLQSVAVELEASGNRHDLAVCETEVARAHLLLGGPREAAEVAMRALGRLRGGDRLEAARARVVLAGAQYALGNGHAAEQAYGAAVSDLERAGAGRQAASAWLELAELAEQAGQPQGALDAYRRAASAAGLRPAPAGAVGGWVPSADTAVETIGTADVPQ